MKTNLLISFFILMVASTMTLNAQDTIDTAYYRYNFHFPPRATLSDSYGTYVFPPYPPMLVDSVTGQNVIDPETGEGIPVCPNGLGFNGFDIHPAQTHYLLDTHLPIYTACVMRQPVSTIYGLAIYLDHIADFTVGDSAEFIMAERSSETGRVTQFDTIVLKGGEVGIRRKLEVPLMPSNMDELCYSVHNSCIDTVKYATVMEFYLDTPHQLLGDTLYIFPQFGWQYGSQFYVADFKAKYLLYNTEWVFHDDTMTGGDYWEESFVGFDTAAAKMLCAVPIIEPLPDWEVALLDTLIPMPTKPENPDPDPNDPNNPDNPGDPNDPDNPDDPNNPDNPEDPEDPTDPEAIDGVYGNIPISIYPNPTNGVTTIISPEAIKELTVTDLAGRELLHRSSLGTTTTLDTAPLEPGLYLLKVTTASGTATTKLAVR